MNGIRDAMKIWAASSIIFFNNVALGVVLRDREATNLYAVWQSSSLIVLIMIYIIAYAKVMRCLNDNGSKGNAGLFFFFYIGMLPGIVSCVFATIITSDILSVNNIIYTLIQCILLAFFVVSVKFAHFHGSKQSLKKHSINGIECDQQMYENALKSMAAMLFWRSPRLTA